MDNNWGTNFMYAMYVMVCVTAVVGLLGIASGNPAALAIFGVIFGLPAVYATIATFVARRSKKTKPSTSQQRSE